MVWISWGNNLDHLLADDKFLKMSLAVAVLTNARPRRVWAKLICGKQTLVPRGGLRNEIYERFDVINWRDVHAGGACYTCWNWAAQRGLK